MVVCNFVPISKILMISGLILETRTRASHNINKTLLLIHFHPGRALIHVFNNPTATEGYLSWGYLSNKLEFFTPYKYK